MAREKTIGKALNSILFVSVVSFVGTVPVPAESHKPRLSSVIADMDTVRTHHLSNGTVLKQVQSWRFIRDAHGRTRIEQDDRVFINDPVLKRIFVLVPAARTAYKAASDPSAHSGIPAPQPGNESEMRLKAELGQRTIEGITVRGKEWVKTIPANSRLGNDRPIEQTFTVWYSEQLALAIRTTVHSPLFGVLETSFRNIQTGVEIDSSLFDVPADYKLVDRLTP